MPTERRTIRLSSGDANRNSPPGSPDTSARTTHEPSVTGSTDRVTRMGKVDSIVSIVMDLPGSKATTSNSDSMSRPRNEACWA